MAKVQQEVAQEAQQEVQQEALTVEELRVKIQETTDPKEQEVLIFKLAELEALF